MYSFFFRRLSWAEILFLIFLRIFLSDFSSALVSGSRVGMGYPSARRVRFSSSVRMSVPVEPFGWLLMSGVCIGCLEDPVDSRPAAIEEADEPEEVPVAL
uniref:Putative secreted peptide n=1 Tax=Anopheles braziliensis TaxID=58242 RepID=A0A2M3ZU83_9DIPT